MFLVVTTVHPPVKKKYWSSKRKEDRGEWSEIMEGTVQFFCTSHGFRKENTMLFIISYKEEYYLIKFIGQELRYLSPNMRSVASLLDKAYRKLKGSRDRWIDSTPGVYAMRTDSLDFVYAEIPKPICKFVFPSSEHDEKKNCGSLLYDPHNILSHDSQFIAPWIHFSQVILWEVNKEMFQYSK